MLKRGFRKKSFIMNAPLFSQLSISVITFGWVQHQTSDDRYAQLTRGVFMINDFLQNPTF